MVRQQSGIVLLSTYLDILSRGPIILQHTAHNTSPRTASPHRQHTPSLVFNFIFPNIRKIGFKSSHFWENFPYSSKVGNKIQNSWKYDKLERLIDLIWLYKHQRAVDAMVGRWPSEYFTLTYHVSFHFPADKSAMFDNVQIGQEGI